MIKLNKDKKENKHDLQKNILYLNKINNKYIISSCCSRV